MKIIAQPVNILGLIFDIDQTLYDNREYYDGQKTLLIKKLAKSQGKSFDKMSELINKVQQDYMAKNDGRKLSLGNLLLRFGISLEESCIWRTKLFKPEKYLKKDRKLISTMKNLSKEYKIAAVTNTSTQIARRTLKVLGILSFFCPVVGIEKTLISKPTIKPYIYVSEKLQIPLQNFISIGDRFEIDVELPVKYGMGGIVVEGIEDVYALPEILKKEHE